jgi:hypothetical protein
VSESERVIPADFKATRAWFAAHQSPEGVDLTLIVENLKRSPEERLRRADQAREDAIRLRTLARRVHDHPS